MALARGKIIKAGNEEPDEIEKQISQALLDKTSPAMWTGSLQRTKGRNTARKAQQRDIQELQYKAWVVGWISCSCLHSVIILQHTVVRLGCFDNDPFTPG